MVDRLNTNRAFIGISTAKQNQITLQCVFGLLQRRRFLIVFDIHVDGLIVHNPKLHGTAAAKILSNSFNVCREMIKNYIEVAHFLQLQTDET